jgi:hypothetical protein
MALLRDSWIGQAAGRADALHPPGRVPVWAYRPVRAPDELKSQYQEPGAPDYSMRPAVSFSPNQSLHAGRSLLATLIALRDKAINNLLLRG